MVHAHAAARAQKNHRKQRGPPRDAMRAPHPRARRHAHDGARRQGCKLKRTPRGGVVYSRSQPDQLRRWQSSGPKPVQPFDKNARPRHHRRYPKCAVEGRDELGVGREVRFAPRKNALKLGSKGPAPQQTREAEGSAAQAVAGQTLHLPGQFAHVDVHRCRSLDRHRRRPRELQHEFPHRGDGCLPERPVSTLCARPFCLHRARPPFPPGAAPGEMDRAADVPDPELAHGVGLDRDRRRRRPRRPRHHSAVHTCERHGALFR